MTTIIPPDFEGFIAVVKRDCPTCVLVEPALRELDARDVPLLVYTQDDPTFPAGVRQVVDDTDLERSYRLDIETVPTLIRVESGREQARIVGWLRDEWRRFTGQAEIGAGLPEYRPGCGSLSVEYGMPEKLAIRFGDTALRARRVEIAALEDEFEAMDARGWTDGLPVVPPTEARVLRMLAGTQRPPDEVLGAIPPDNVECTVEKAAINAVMAGCKPEYLPVVLAAVEASCMEAFGMHGVLATTYFVGPVVIVNGPLAKAIGMNSGGNVFGQGSRANATIGRALQLVIRNVGGGRPGEVDRATFGTPGKYTFCFAEDEAGSPWESLAVEQGYASDVSTVTLFAGGGVQPIIDQKSRTPESLAKSFALSLLAVGHHKLALATDAFLVISPEHSRVFRAAGWSKARLKDELYTLLERPGSDLIGGAGGVAEGMPPQFADKPVPKFRPGGLNIVHAGGTAGMWSAIIAGWPASGPKGSQPVTKEIRP